MSILPTLRQLLVIASPQMAAFAVGGAVTYPSVLLQQLRTNETTIPLDLNSSSWIGSIDGLAGIPSILMPTVMQWKGRKFAFQAACLISIIGWIITYAATTVSGLYISESFHGLGTHCILSVSLLSISEMVAPKYRNMSLVSFHLVQNFGMTLVGVLARFLHWKTISIIMCAPLTIAFFIACKWPESPYWLAYKGKYRKSKEAFYWLRGIDDAVQQELKELISACREDKMANKKENKMTISSFLNTVTRRDFYLPAIFMFILLNSMYWSGLSVIIIYFVEISKRCTNNDRVTAMGSVIANTTVFLAICFVTILLKFMKNKTVILSCNISVTIILLSSSLVTYLQTVGTLSKDSLFCVYLLVIYVFSISCGVNKFATAAELMPVKHKGLGGALYVIYIGILHTSSLKSGPYLFLYIDLWGTFLIFAANATICGLLIWKFVPETKGKTLQEIEDYYLTLSFKRTRQGEGTTNEDSYLNI